MYILLLLLGLIVLFKGSASLSDTDLLRRVGHDPPVFDILENSVVLEINFKLRSHSVVYPYKDQSMPYR